MFSEMSWLMPADQVVIDRLVSGAFDEQDLLRLRSARFSEKQARSIAKYLTKTSQIDGLTPIKVAFLTDANLQFAVTDLIATGTRYGLQLDIKLIEYTNIIENTTNPDSELYQFQPDFVIYANFGSLFLNLCTNFSEDREHQSLVQLATEQIRTELSLVAQSVSEHSNAHLMVQTLPSTAPDLFANLDRVQPQAFGAEILALNCELLKSNYDVIDIAALAEKIGLYSWIDDAKFHWAKLPFSPAYQAIYCDWVLRRLAVSKGVAKKCLVLDLDNTLWGGVIGDDGVEGISLGNNSPTGEAFLAGQQFYKMLSNRGIVLAVCSKNDIANAQLPFQQHPDMVLKLDDIACFVANWQDKPSNIKFIAKSLNLGLSSFVFLDDNPMERDLVRQELPEVAVPNVPDDEPSLYPRILAAAGYFEGAGFTSADVKRLADYKANAQRAQVQESATDIDSYLKALEMRFEFEAIDPVNNDRIVQLINRSNQFNLTTKRYTNSEVAKFYKSNKKLGFSGRLIDKFADTGLVVLLICEECEHENDPCWEIDTWVMSCRVLGRKAEQITLKAILKAAQSSGVKYLMGRYIPTPKNGMVRDHYEKLGFTRILHGTDSELPEQSSTWILGVDEGLNLAALKELPFDLKTTAHISSAGDT